MRNRIMAFLVTLAVGLCPGAALIAAASPAGSALAVPSPGPTAGPEVAPAPTLTAGPATPEPAAEPPAPAKGDPAVTSTAPPAPAPTAAPDPDPESAVDTAPAIRWLTYAEGMAKAEELGRLVLIDFSANWCRYCKLMEKQTYADPAVISYLNEHFVPVMVNTQVQQGLANRYGVRGLPTTWFLSSKGERISSVPGYVDAGMFLKLLSFIATGSYQALDFQSYVESLPADD